MNKMQRMSALTGRGLLALFFLWSGINLIMHWSQAEKTFTGDLINWHLYVSQFNWLEHLTEAILPFKSQVIAFGAFLQIGGGLMLLAGWRPRFAAVMLAVFLLVHNAFANYFWLMEGYQREVLLQQFVQNLTILSGLFLLMAFKSGHREMTEQDVEPHTK